MVFSTPSSSCRKVAEIGQQKSCKIEVYLLELRLTVYKTEYSCTENFSRGDTIGTIMNIVTLKCLHMAIILFSGELMSTLKMAFHVLETTECRMWHYFKTEKTEKKINILSNVHGLLSKNSQTLEEAEVRSGQVS